MLTSNTYSCHKNAALSNPGGERYHLWQKVGVRPRRRCPAKGKTPHIWQSAISPRSKNDWTQNGCDQWKQLLSAVPPMLAA